MKKKIEYYEYFCDRCQCKVQRLYGRNDGHFLLPLDNIEQSQHEECKITPQYYLHQNSGREVNDGGICIKCLKEILQRTIERIIYLESENV